MPSSTSEIRNVVQESRQSVIHASGPLAYWNVCGEHVLFVWYGNSIITWTHACGHVVFSRFLPRLGYTQPCCIEC
jgi:hypothetical protein